MYYVGEAGLQFLPGMFNGFLQFCYTEGMNRKTAFVRKWLVRSSVLLEVGWSDMVGVPWSHSLNLPEVTSLSLQFTRQLRLAQTGHGALTFSPFSFCLQTWIKIDLCALCWLIYLPVKSSSLNLQMKTNSGQNLT